MVIGWLRGFLVKWLVMMLMVWIGERLLMHCFVSTREQRMVDFLLFFLFPLLRLWAPL